MFQFDANAPGLAELPETSEVASLLGEMMGLATPPIAAQSARPLEAVELRPRLRPSTMELGGFLKAVNWRNKPIEQLRAAQPQPAPTADTPIRELSLAQFLKVVNWSNAYREAAPAAPEPHEAEPPLSEPVAAVTTAATREAADVTTVDNVFDEFSWE